MRVLDELTAIHGAPAHPPQPLGAGIRLGSGTEVVRGARGGHAIHRPRVTLVVQDRREIQPAPAGRAALVEDLRHTGRALCASGPMKAPLQPTADPAATEQTVSGGLCGAANGAAYAPAPCARLRCRTAGPPGPEGEATVYQLSQRVNRRERLGQFD
jgi:hypothetical protein